MAGAQKGSLESEAPDASASAEARSRTRHGTRVCTLEVSVATPADKRYGSPPTHFAATPHDGLSSGGS